MNSYETNIKAAFSGLVASHVRQGVKLGGEGIKEVKKQRVRRMFRYLERASGRSF